MYVAHRNAVRVQGAGPAMIFAHGFGCNQAMWRLLTPRFAERFRVITFDLVGSGQSDLRAYDATKYASLNGYASDLVEIIDEFALGPALIVGHSVSAMIGVLADLQGPGRFAGHLMVAPSPCYVNDGDYVGGFSRADIDGLLNMLESNYLGWCSSMAPSIMGSPSQPELAHELETSFCRNDPGSLRVSSVGLPQGTGTPVDAVLIIHRPRIHSAGGAHPRPPAQQHVAGCRQRGLLSPLERAGRQRRRHG